MTQPTAEMRQDMAYAEVGDEILVGEGCHILMHEVGGAAVLSSVQTRSFPANLGYVDTRHLEKTIRGSDIH